jgi:uncharacterized membrane protein HdeD (DUF308 family)
MNSDIIAGGMRSREVLLISTLIQNWWLLAVCGGLEAIYSLTNFFMRAHDGSLSLRTNFLRSTVMFLGKVAVACGACTIAAALWRSAKGRSWLLVLNGLAFSALGLIFMFWRGRLSFLSIATLLIVMALSIAIFDFDTARTLRRHVAGEWFIRAAGVVSIGFALAFLALGFGLIGHGPQSNATILWMGAYFGFSAICMVALALRLHSLNTFSQEGGKLR